MSEISEGIVELEKHDELPKTDNHLFPVFLKLEELRVLLVGGGNVGLEKLTAILTNAPATFIHIVAPAIDENITRLAARHPNVLIEKRNFQPGDLEEKELVVIAINEKKESLRIRQMAKEKKLLVNVADTPEQCDFYLSSIVQKGNLKIAISTNGKSPTVAKRIKEVLNEVLPGELDETIENIHKVRSKLNGNFAYKVKKLNALTKILVEKDNADKEKRWRKIATYSLIGFALMLIGHFVFSYLPFQEIADDTISWYNTLDKNFPLMVVSRFPGSVGGWCAGNGVWGNKRHYYAFGRRKPGGYQCQYSYSRNVCQWCVRLQPL